MFSISKLTHNSESHAVPSTAASANSSTNSPRRLSAALKSRLKLVGASVLAMGVLAGPLLGNLTPTLASGVADGMLVSDSSTLPRATTWLNDASGGHLWVTDNVLGICRLDPSPLGNAPFGKNMCQGAVKAGGQILVATPPTTTTGLPAGAKYVYVADDGSKTASIVRMVFNPAATGTTNPMSGTLPMAVQNVTSIGGGAGGGRAVGLGLIGNDLYVGYLKSGDIMKITDAQHTTSGSPPVAKVGSTSDGKGINALLVFNNDLFLAESGGFGLSKIGDPSGLARVACSAAAPCTAATVKPSPSFFPGGLATDGTNIYIGDAPRAALNSILRYNPATGATDTYSDKVPAYTSSFDGATRTQYYAPYGLGFGPGGDLYVGDDATLGLPAAGAAAPAPLQGHIWKIPAAANPVSVTSVGPNIGSTAGGDAVTITGAGFATDGSTVVSFGSTVLSPAAVTCATSISCTTTSPAGTGTVDVHVSVGGRTSPISAGDTFTYAPPANTVIAVASVTNLNGTTTVPGVTGASGVTTGGTPILVTGQDLATTFDANGAATVQPAIAVGSTPATSVGCFQNPGNPQATNTSCVATTAAANAGTVDVHATLNSITSPISAGDKFTYIAPSATLYAWGITAPKGGAVWLPTTTSTIAGSTGHWWSSDHAQGLCRQDSVPGSSTLHAINFSACGDDLVGSAGQAVYDARPIPGAANPNLHYVYVPDNAVKSTAVWRLTFDPSSEKMVPDPLGGAMATAMLPLADVRTLKPNGMALGPDGSLYVTDLTELSVRKITGVNGDPRSQTIAVVAQTGDLRGANGTQGFIGNLLYISENRGTAFFDVTQCPMPGGAPCGTIKIPLNVPPAGVFVAGTAVDAVHKFVYSSDSPGGASAGIYRYDASNDKYVAFAAGSAGLNPRCASAGVPVGCAVGSAAPIVVSNGTLPAAGSPEATVWCAVAVAPSIGCQRPWDSANRGLPGSTTGFSFTFGLGVDSLGNLAITEDPSAGARSGRGTMWTVPFIP